MQPQSMPKSSGFFGDEDTKSHRHPIQYNQPKTIDVAQRRGDSVSARDFVSQAPIYFISHFMQRSRGRAPDGAAPKRSRAERKQARGLSQATNKFHSGRRLFSQAFPNYAHFHTYFVTRECGIMLRIIYVQILHIMTTACSAMEEFEILKSRKFSYHDRDIASFSDLLHNFIHLR